MERLPVELNGSRSRELTLLVVFRTPFRPRVLGFSPGSLDASLAVAEFPFSTTLVSALEAAAAPEPFLEVLVLRRLTRPELADEDWLSVDPDGPSSSIRSGSGDLGTLLSPAPTVAPRGCAAESL